MNRNDRIGILAVLLITIFAFLRSTAHADELVGCGEIIDVYTYGNKLFALCSDEGAYKINVIDDSLCVSSCGVDLSPEDTAYAFFRGKFYFMSSEYDDKNICYKSKITSVNCSKGDTTSRVMNNVSPRFDLPFGFDGNNYYFAFFSNIGIYDKSLNQIDETPLTGDCYGFFPSDDGEGLFCVCGDGVKYMKNGSVIDYPVNARRVCQFNDYFSNENSVVYSLSSGEVVYDGFDPTNGNACVGEWLIGKIGDDLAAVRGEDVVVIGSAFDTSFIRAVNETLYCLTPEGTFISVDRFTADDIELLYEEQMIQSDSGEYLTDTDLFETDSEVSDIGDNIDIIPPYVFDEDNMTVNGIDIGTTAAKFRNECGDSGAVFYKADGSRIKSGVLGTGMTVCFSDGNSYTIIIYGDVTGEGSVNTRDYRAIRDHLFGDSELDGVYYEAGDIVCSGQVDLADLTALARYTHSKYEIAQK